MGEFVTVECYAAYYDNSIRERSSSGGCFSVLASNYDVVYGVAMTLDCYGVEFVRASDDIDILRGSKYVQADPGLIFHHVKRDLESGLRVLFTGTSCQVNGLNFFLNKDFENLTCVDFICHGVPSPILWRKYLKHQEEKQGKISKVFFRAKPDGWRAFGIQKDELFSSKNNDSYMFFFLNNMGLRPCCYKCLVRRNKKADITIADFWGIEKVAPNMDDDKGTSLVIIRTNRGKNEFDKIKDKLNCKRVGYYKSIKGNKAEYQSPREYRWNKKFCKDVGKLTYEQIEKKYFKK